MTSRDRHQRRRHDDFHVDYVLAQVHDDVHEDLDRDEHLNAPKVARMSLIEYEPGGRGERLVEKHPGNVDDQGSDRHQNGENPDEKRMIR